MMWETPAFEEVEMNAEIGAYQGDGDGNEPPAPTPPEAAAAEQPGDAWS